jgi:hypothetical protein
MIVVSIAVTAHTCHSGATGRDHTINQLSATATYLYRLRFHTSINAPAHEFEVLENHQRVDACDPTYCCISCLSTGCYRHTNAMNTGMRSAKTAEPMTCELLQWSNMYVHTAANKVWCVIVTIWTSLRHEWTCQNALHACELNAQNQDTSSHNKTLRVAIACCVQVHALRSRTCW